MRPKIIDAEAGEPITLAECRTHLNIYPYEVDSDGVRTHPDDAMILAMLEAARVSCEDFTGRAITRKTYEIALDNFPFSNPQYVPSSLIDAATSSRNGAIELPMPPLVSVVSVMVGDTSDALMTTDEYLVDDYSQPAKLYPPTGTYWPSIASAKNQIKVRYIAGYGVDSDGNIPLPAAIRHAILLALGSMYANREDVAELLRGGFATLPNGVESLLRPYRVKLGMA